MLTANFVQDTYELRDEHNQLLFDDNKHGYLFDYLRVEFTQIEKMLESFFSEQFDFERMHLKKDRPALAYSDDYVKAQQSNFLINKWDYVIDNAYLSGIVDCLKKNHPYFAIDSNALKCTEAILVDYFNSKLYCSEDILHEDDYVNTLEELLAIPPFFPIRMKISLNKERNFNLDILNHYIDYVSTYDRYGYLRRMLKKGRKIEPPLLKIIEEQQFINKLLFSLLRVSDNATSEQKNEKFNFDLKLDLVVFIEGSIIREKFNLTSISQLLHYEAFQMVKTGVKIKMCRCCNGFFVAGDMRKNYCERVIKGDKTCMDVGPNQYFRNQKKNDDMYKAYRKALSKNLVRLEREAISDEQYKYWQEKANEKRENKSEDFYDWLGLRINEIKDVYEKSRIPDAEK